MANAQDEAIWKKVMSNHLIIMFDHSGSMAGPFVGDLRADSFSGLPARHSIKLEEAKRQLVSWLKTSNYYKASIFPFSSDADKPLTVLLPEDINIFEKYINNFPAQGGTNLSAALSLALEVGTREEESSFVRYLIVTDGRSSTPQEDFELLYRLPLSQGIDGILIDPNKIGMKHLQRLCVRGRYIPVHGSEELEKRIKEQEETYSNRMNLNDLHLQACKEAKTTLPRLKELKLKLSNASPTSKAIRQIVDRAIDNQHNFELLKSQFTNQLADANVSEQVLKSEINDIQENNQKAKELVETATVYLSEQARFKVSIAHPLKLAKGYSVTFLVQIYPLHLRPSVEKRIKKVMKDWEHIEEDVGSSLTPGMSVEIALSSPDIIFLKPATKTIDKSGVDVSFFGKPTATCNPGNHTVILTIIDTSTEERYESISFRVTVVDYAFDHISKPFLVKLLSFVMGIGSFIMFVLGLLGQIDKSFGLASGTAGGAIIAYMFARMSKLYRRPETTLEYPE